nr:immunoglobulin light chain junction region [Macaca mulatta]
CLQYSRSPFTF